MINVFHIVSNKIWSGPEQYAHDLASRLKDDNNFYVEVVCKPSDTVYQKFRQLEIPISMLPLKGMADFDSPVRFARLIKKGKNIIHVHSFQDAVNAILAKHIAENPDTKIVLTLHGLTHPRLNYISRKVYRELDRLVFVSQRAYNEFVPRFKGFDKSKAVIIRDSVLPEPHGQAGTPSLRQKLEMSPEQALIMFHGRLSQEKGVDTLLKAVSQLDHSTFKLVLIGEGFSKYVSQLKAFIVANQLVRNVSFLGYNPNVQAYIAQCDLGVLPSTVPEALGLSNLEYMMQGKAHIASNNGAQEEYLEDGRNAVLINPSNPHVLAAAIKRLIDDPALRNQLGEQAKIDFNSRLNYDAFYEQMTALYASLF